MKKNSIKETYHTISKSPIGYISQHFQKSGQNCIVMYHGVQTEPNPRCVSPDYFSQHIQYLQTIGNIVPLKTLILNLNSKSGKPNIALTFDDAYKNLLDDAIPLLERLNLPATIYVPYDYIGKSNMWDKDKSEPMLPILTVAEIKQIISNELFTIGSHGFSHRRLSCLKMTELKDEIIKSKKVLEDTFGVPIESFSYPHGGRSDYDRRAVELVQTAGYTNAVSTRFSRQNSQMDLWDLNRIPVWPEDTIERFKLKISGRYDWIVLKEKLAYKVKQYIRK